MLANQVQHSEALGGFQKAAEGRGDGENRSCSRNQKERDPRFLARLRSHLQHGLDQESRTSRHQERQGHAQSYLSPNGDPGDPVQVLRSVGTQ